MGTGIVQDFLGLKWWTAEHVRQYIHAPTVSAANRWMHRHGVRRCPANKKLTCQAWVDAALEGRPGRSPARKGLTP